MRVALAISLYAPEFQGGATLVCRRLAQELVARGHLVDVFSGRTTASEPLGAVRREPVDGVHTWRVNLGGAFLPWSREGYANPVADASFAAFLEEARPDVLHAHSLQALGVGLFAVAARARVPIVWTMHDWWWLCPCLFRLAPSGEICPPLPSPEHCARHAGYDFAPRRGVLESALERVARVLVPSAYLRDSLIANGLDAARVAVQENGVPPPGEGVADARRRRAAGAGAPLRFGFIGGAGNREKGLDVLLDAVARLGDARFELHLYAVEPGAAAAYEPALGARLRLHPAFPATEIDRALQPIDVLVVPSLMRESFSLVAREALLRGIPLVTSDCGGPEEVVREGENGLVFESGSAASLAAVLGRLIGDPELVAHLASAPPPRCATPAAQARAAEALYREVLRESVVGASGDADARGPRRRANEALRGRRVLFLTGIDGASLRYRVWHLVEQLAAAGVESAVLYHSDLGALPAARRADCVVLFRAPYSVTVAAVVAEARRRRVPVVFSVDDLVFAPDAGGDAPALSLDQPQVVAGYRASLEWYARSFAAADYFLGTTEALVDAARARGAVAYLLRNGLGRPMAARAHRARQAKLRGEAQALAATGERPRIGFFSGTDTHDRDLARIAPALGRTLERFPGAVLVLGGTVGLPDCLARFASRIERVPFVPWSELPTNLAGLALNLAPLELPSAFNEAKSEVKLLEAALVSVPTIASPSRAFRAATRDGEVGLLAGSDEEWETALAALLAAPERRVALGRAARRDVLRRYAPGVQAPELHAILTEILARGPTAGAAPPSAVVMEAGGGSAVAIEPKESVYDSYQLIAESGGPLRPGREVEQEIPCRGDGVWRVDLLVGTYGRRNDHTVQLSVVDEAGALRARRDVPAAALVDRCYVSLELDAPLGRGRRLRVRAAAPEAEPGNEILLWTGPSPLGELRIGGEPVPERALALRTFGEASG